MLISSLEKNVNIQSLPNGIYLIKIMDKGGKIISINKLIKK